MCWFLNYKTIFSDSKYWGSSTETKTVILRFMVPKLESEL